ncbi:MAG: hypothetical protein D6771_06610 [Zetaproteobacteria bacterium]|nr:MAG: hypothetical protein D6771_06610 [Zetaproteobacteria bacterium]
MREHHGCGVRGADWRLGEDWAGDPAVFVWLVVDDEAWDGLSESERERVERAVRERLERVSSEYGVYVRIRSVADRPVYEDVEYVQEVVGG